MKGSEIHMTFNVTEDTIIGDIMDADESTAEYFLEMGMHCLYCPSSRGESIKQACEVHGVNPDDLIAKLNAHFAE
jgi:hybrid cluster-associated redox disulfide protein